MTLRLNANISTGYSWVPKATNNDIISFSGMSYVTLKSINGNSVGENCTFYASIIPKGVVGETDVIFEYKRPGDGMTVETLKMHVSVDKDGRMTLN